MGLITSRELILLKAFQRPRQWNRSQHHRRQQQLQRRRIYRTNCSSSQRFVTKEYLRSRSFKCRKRSCSEATLQIKYNKGDLTRRQVNVCNCAVIHTDCVEVDYQRDATANTSGPRVSRHVFDVYSRRQPHQFPVSTLKQLVEVFNFGV